MDVGMSKTCSSGASPCISIAMSYARASQSCCADSSRLPAPDPSCLRVNMIGAAQSCLERDVFVGDFWAGAASWCGFVVGGGGVEVVAAAVGASAHGACSGAGCCAVGAST